VVAVRAIAADDNQIRAANAALQEAAEVIGTCGGTRDLDSPTLRSSIKDFYLKPRNKRYKDIRPVESLNVFGVVTG
jgi:hypothetical protein